LEDLKVGRGRSIIKSVDRTIFKPPFNIKYTTKDSKLKSKETKEKVGANYGNCDFR
jgi:hypothetical protein